MTDFRRFSNPIAQPIRNFAMTNPELEQITTATAAKIDSLKKWTVSTYKNTKHMCMEQLGKIDKTVDKELDERIESLRELRKSYRELHSSAQHFSNYLGLANTMQRHMASAFCELGAKETAIALEVLHKVGHAVHEDSPELVAKIFVQIVSRYKAIFREK